MPPFDASYAVAALGGLLSFLSPCVLPLAPAYLSFMAGASLEDLLEAEQPDGTAQEAALRRSIARRALWGAASFVLGFSTIFVALGAGASAVNALLLEYREPAGRIAGAVVVLFGLHYMGALRIHVLHREMRLFPALLPSGSAGAAAGVRHVFAPYLLGLAFAFGWTPCIGPILATILAVAASHESTGTGMALLGVYSLGLGVPFLAAGLGVHRFLRFSRRFRRHLPKVEAAAGVLLVITGALIFTGSLARLSWGLLDVFPFLGRLG